MRREGLLHRGLARLQGGPTAGRRHRFFEHLLIELDTDLADMARLLLAQQVAGAADVEVVAGELEAGAEIIQSLHDLKALFRRRGQNAARRQGEVGIAADLGAADPAAKLIELGQAEHVGAVHDHGVGRRDVEAGLDDVGREQQIEAAVVEAGHHRLQVARRELTVSDTDLHFGHELGQALRKLAQILDARADDEDLPAPEVFAHDRLAHDHRVVGQDEGAHRQAVDRRRGDEAHLLHPRHRELQGARDRRRRQGQHVDVLAQLLQALLLLDAEVLLLVDDDQAQVAEAHRLRQERMGADDDVDLAGGKLRAGLALRSAGDEARELADLHRQAAKAVREGPVVLAGQQRGRHHDRHLATTHDGEKGGPQRHLGLAEADIAADQPVHRASDGQVRQRVLDGTLLVFGLGEGKARGELGIETFGRFDAVDRLQLARRGDLDQLGGHVLQALLDPRLAGLPVGATQAVEFRRALLRAIARKDLDVLHRHIELVAAVIGHHQTVVGRAAHVERDQALVSADAVLDMDDEIAFRESGDLGEEVLGPAALGAGPGQALAQDVLLGDQGDAVEGKAPLDRQQRERDTLREQSIDPRPILDALQLGHSMIAQERSQALQRAGAVGGDDDPLTAPL